MARFEVTGRENDRDLIRAIARRLAAGGPEVTKIRSALGGAIEADEPKRGGILAALRLSPMCGAGLDLSRVKDAGRKID